MSNMALPAVELACVPGAIPAKERSGHFALARELLINRAREQIDLENGYAFRFDPDALTSLVMFVENERKCCSFLTFNNVVSPDSGPIWLRMTGPAGTREVLRAELELSGACGCNEGRQSIACSIGNVADGEKRLLTWTVTGGIMAALGICAACCLLPAALIGIGITGAWVGSMESLGAYKWLFMMSATVTLGFAFFKLYVKPRQGFRIGDVRKISRHDRELRRMFWAGTALAVAGIAYGFVEPWLLSERLHWRFQSAHR